MEAAFAGPKKIADRMSGFSVTEIADSGEEEFAELCVVKPAIHRYGGSIARRVHAMARYVVDNHDGRREGSEEGLTVSAGVRADGVPNLLAEARVSLARAVRATEEAAFDLHTVTENAAPAVLTHRSDPLSRTFEAVEGVDVTAFRVDLEGHPVVVSTDVAGSHTSSVRVTAGPGNTSVRWSRTVPASGPA